MKPVVLLTAGVCLILGSLFFLTQNHGNLNNGGNTTQWLNAFLEAHTEGTNNSSGFLIEPTTKFFVVVAIPPDPCDMCIHSMLNLIRRTELDALDGTKVCIIADESVARPLRKTMASLHMCVSVFSEIPKNLPADYISLYVYELRTNKCIASLSIKPENPFDSSTENALISIKNRMRTQMQIIANGNNQ